ncbi:MAG: hypothetical protein Kow0058_17940 [Roseovarius sp.]
MAARQPPPPPSSAFSPGSSGDARAPRITAIELAATALSLLWLALSGAFFLLSDPAKVIGGDRGAVWFIIVLLAVFLPVAMIWLAATAARTARLMREESRRLQVAIDAIRQAYVAQSQGRNAQSEAALARKLEEIAAAQRKTETTLAMVCASRAVDATPAGAPRPSAPVAAAAAAEQDDAGQPALPLGTPAEEMPQPPLQTADFIRALNFPETAEDRDGFAALRRALRERETARLIRAAQDVLTLMSQDGIYMDDLRPDLPRPEIWRRFAAGGRGRAVAMLGGIRDRSSLALTAARMKNDPVFRDAAHHFLRLFDRMIAQFADTASDAELTEMSNTRTARAFMLLGRVTGIFD